MAAGEVVEPLEGDEALVEPPGVILGGGVGTAPMGGDGGAAALAAEVAKPSGDVAESSGEAVVPAEGVVVLGGDVLRLLVEGDEALGEVVKPLEGIDPLGEGVVPVGEGAVLAGGAVVPLGEVVVPLKAGLALPDRVVEPLEEVAGGLAEGVAIGDMVTPPGEASLSICKGDEEGGEGEGEGEEGVDPTGDPPGESGDPRARPAGNAGTGLEGAWVPLKGLGGLPGATGRDLEAEAAKPHLGEVGTGDIDA